MFENLSSAIKEDEDLDERLKTSITQHLQSLETVFQQYFLELKEKEAAIVRNQFSSALDISDILDELQEQFHHLQMICPHVIHRESYPQVSELAFRILLPFSLT